MQRRRRTGRRPPAPGRSGRAGSSVASVRLKWSSVAMPTNMSRVSWRDAQVERRRRRRPRRTRRSRPATPSASHRISPPRPVGSTVVDRLHLVGPRLQLRPGRSRRRPTRSARSSTARRCGAVVARTARAAAARRRRGRGGRAGRRPRAARTAAAGELARARRCGRQHDGLAPVVGLPLQADRVALDRGAARVARTGRSVMRGHPLGVRRQRGQPLAALVELLEGEGAHRLEHAVADAVRRRGLGRQHALVHQRGHVLGGRRARRCPAAARRGGRRRARSRWGTRPASGTSAARRRRAAGTTSRSWRASCRAGRRPGAGRRSSRLNAVVEGARRSAGTPERRGAGRGQLDGQRDAVEPAADVLDHRVAPSSRGRRRRPRPAARNSSTAVARVERPHRHDVLAVDAQGLAAGGDHRQVGAPRRQLVDRPRRRCRRRARSCRPPAACALAGQHRGDRGQRVGRRRRGPW